VLVHLITSIESGGAQRVMYEYLKAACHKEKHVVFYLKGAPFFRENLEKLNIDTYKVESITNILTLLSFVRNAGIIKAWMYHACVVSSLLKLIMPKTRIVWSIHHGSIVKSDTISTKLFCNIASFFSSFVPAITIYPSLYCRNSHIKYGFNSVNNEIVFNPVDLDKFKLSREPMHKKCSIGFCGRNHPNKRFDLFIESALKFCHHCDFVNFVVCGDGTSNSKVLEAVRAEGLSSRFVFLGELDDVSQFYRDVDIFTSLSETESFGLTLIEAYAAGCALVCTDIDVFRELFSDVPFYVCEPSVDAVIRAWKLSINSPLDSVDDIFLQQFSTNVFYERYSKIIHETT